MVATTNESNLNLNEILFIIIHQKHVENVREEQHELKYNPIFI